MTDAPFAGADAAPVGQSNPTPDQTPTPPPPPVQDFKGTKHKLKINGREEELEYEKVIERAQKYAGSEERFKTAKAIEDKYNRLKDPNADNFDELVAEIGWEKASKFARRLVMDEMKWEELTEEQREVIIERRKAEDATRRLTEYEKRQEQAQLEANRAASVEIVDRELSAALAEARAAGVPVSDLPEIAMGVVDEMLNYLEWSEQEEKEGRRPTQPPPSPKDVIGKLQQTYDGRTEAYLKKLSPDQLRKKLSPEQLKAIREGEITDLRSSMPFGTKTPKEKSSVDPFSDDRRKPPQDNRRMKTDDFFSKMDKKFGV